MIGMRIADFKEGFFDREKVKNSMNAATRRAASKFGAFVRTRARSSIKKSDGSSEPGQPPKSHDGSLRKWILFAAEPDGNVVIGPALLSGKVSPTALNSLEHGGETLVEEHGKTKAVMIRERPFMQPAFEAEVNKAPKLWEAAMR